MYRSLKGALVRAEYVLVAIRRGESIIEKVKDAANWLDTAGNRSGGLISAIPSTQNPRYRALGCVQTVSSGFGFLSNRVPRDGPLCAVSLESRYVVGMIEKSPERRT